MNSLAVNLKGKHVVIKEELFTTPYKDLKQRVVKVTGGFGASHKTSGTTLLVEFAIDGIKGKFDGWDVERVIEEVEVEKLFGYR